MSETGPAGANAVNPAAEDRSTGFVRELGTWDSTMIVAGSMIGSGIFIVSADITRQVGSAGWLLMAWVVTGLLTVAAALSYGELAAMMPKAGGQYVYLREAYSPLWGFLYGWTLFLVIQTGTIAAVAVGFARFLGVLVPSISPTAWIVRPIDLSHSYALSLSVQQLVGILLILFLTYLNTRGIRLGKLIQNTFTTAKTLSLVALILLGLFVGRNSQAIAANFHDLWTPQNPVTIQSDLGMPATSAAAGALGLLIAFCVAQVGSLFSSDAWNNITFTAGEIKDPQRNLPLSLILGMSAITLIYVGMNVVYLYAMPVGDMISTGTIGEAAAGRLFGPLGSKLMSLSVLVSVFGCISATVISGPRVFYAMANDGLFFRGIAEVHPRHRTPVKAIFWQCLWSSALCLSGTYDQLYTFVIFAAVLFYALAGASVIVLRRRHPEWPRPYRTWGYPMTPIVYVGICVVVLVYTLVNQPVESGWGLAILACGLPAYLYWKRRRDGAAGRAA